MSDRIKILDHEEDIIEGTGKYAHWEIDNKLDKFDFSDTGVVLADGDCLFIYDSTGADYVQICHDGANATYSTNAGAHEFNTDLIPDTDEDYTLGSTSAKWEYGQFKNLRARGGSLRVYDSDSSDYFEITHGGSNTVFETVSGGIRSKDSIEPYSDNAVDLGASDAQWQDIYCIDIICDYIKSTNSNVVCQDHFVPSDANTYDCGSATNYWQDTYTTDLHCTNIRPLSAPMYLHSSLRPNNNNEYSLGISGGTTRAWAAVHSYNYTTVTSPFKAYSDNKSVEIIKKWKPIKINKDGTADCDETSYPEEMAYIDNNGVRGGKLLNKQVDILVGAVKNIIERLEAIENNLKA